MIKCDKLVKKSDEKSHTTQKTSQFSEKSHKKLETGEKKS